MGPGQRKGTTGKYLSEVVLEVINNYAVREGLSLEEVRQRVARRRSGTSSNSIGAALNQLYRDNKIDRIELTPRRIKWMAK